MYQAKIPHVHVTTISYMFPVATKKYVSLLVPELYLNLAVSLRFSCSELSISISNQLCSYITMHINTCLKIIEVQLHRPQYLFYHLGVHIWFYKNNLHIYIQLSSKNIHILSQLCMYIKISLFTNIIIAQQLCIYNIAINIRTYTQHSTTQNGITQRFKLTEGSWKQPR